MSRLVDADKLYPDCMTKDGTLAISQSQLANAQTVPPEYFPPCEDCNKKMEEIRRAYDKMKSMERTQGEWVPDKDKKKWVCSECGAVPSDWVSKSQYATTMVNRFCRYCGAKMYKGEENDESICSTQ